MDNIKGDKNGNDTDRYFDTRLSRRNTHLASQSELGILSQRWNWTGAADCTYPSPNGADLKCYMLDGNKQDDLNEG
jgi:hypothetical protein